MTVNDLLNECEKQIKQGNGNKEIWISTDDEGNGYHKLFYAFSSNVKELDFWKQIDKPKKSIILG